MLVDTGIRGGVEVGDWIWFAGWIGSTFGEIGSEFGFGQPKDLAGHQPLPQVRPLPPIYVSPLPSRSSLGMEQRRGKLRR